MAVNVLGWILIVLGLLASVAGIGGGIATMFQEIQKKVDKNRSFSGDFLPTEFLKALTEFVEALTKAPLWLALTVIGFFLIGWGGTLLPVCAAAI